MIWQGWDLVEVTSWHVPVLAVCVAPTASPGWP